ncbi:Chaperone protein like [Actinidia chinensis var. chinensis]|uniref:Chaperone protein like n=1 Tax=Actinidia chinensis var. chinensis TaxID=1590841 RepID=A0A2R6QPR8_ACTCC|nr:Chaperone protein like [Actinidia chinensis var. chinensis]
MKQKMEPNPHPPTLTDTKQSSTIRFLGLLKQPDSDPNPFDELDESDVVWSSDFSDSGDLHSRSPPIASTSPTTLRRHHNNFHAAKSGLSAALSDDLHNLVRRKSALNPSLSAASAARTIPLVPLGSPASAVGRFPQSAPVNVPIWPKRVGVTNLEKFDEEDEDELDEEMVPPHVIVARSHVTTFSVFEGVGRTLKGRDLRRVRNAVFQKTGFID